MKPFVCKVHGVVDDPTIIYGRHRMYRRCNICEQQRWTENNHKPKSRARAAVWYQQNAERQRARGAQYIAQIKAAIVTGYGGKCECCGETHSEFLTIDHIHGDGREERKVMKGGKLYRWLIANNFPRDRYRLLCMNCNFAHGKYGYCPHNRANQAQVPPPGFWHNDFGHLVEMPFEVWGH